jgi:hypothetical protein
MAEISAWYRDRRDGIWTIDLDPDAVRNLEVGFNGRFAAPVTGVAVAATTPEEGGSASVSVVSFDDDGMVFRADGSGVLATFRVAYGASESDDLTVRLRARQS